MTNKSKLVAGIMVMTVSLALTAGCGSSDKQAAQQPAQQQASGDMKGMSNMNMNMPKGDPMPLVKDVDKDLQDIVKQVKAGQTMDAQQTTGMLVGTVEKIIPHMMNEGLKTNLRKTAADIKDSVNSGKTDPGAIESKVKTMQDMMKQVTNDLQSMKHN